MSIFVFNQSRNPWILKDVADPSVILFSKMKKIKVGGVEKTILLRVAADTNALGNLNSIKTQLSNMVNMNDKVEVLTPKKVTINFDSFTYKPSIQQIIKSTANGKHILLLCLENPDSILLNIEGTDTFILEGFAKGGTVGLVVSLNTAESGLTLTFFNKKTKQLVAEVFSVKGESIVKETQSADAIESGETDDCPIRKFRPARLTDAVFVLDQYEHLLERVPAYIANVRKYKKVVFTENSLSDGIAYLKELGYDAVTLFWKESEMKSNNDFYSRLRSLKESFGLVYTVNEDGKITKSKIR